jgi:hypothetical protein
MSPSSDCPPAHGTSWVHSRGWTSALDPHTHTHTHRRQASAEEFGITLYKTTNGSSPALRKRRPSRTCTRHGLYALRRLHAPRRLTAVTKAPRRGKPYWMKSASANSTGPRTRRPSCRSTCILCATSPGTKFPEHYLILARRPPSSSPLCHTNPDLQLLLRGDDYILIYNEACIFKAGKRHLRAMGSRAEKTWG